MSALDSTNMRNKYNTYRVAKTLEEVGKHFSGYFKPCLGLISLEPHSIALNKAIEGWRDLDWLEEGRPTLKYSLEELDILYKLRSILNGTEKSDWTPEMRRISSDLAEMRMALDSNHYDGDPDDWSLDADIYHINRFGHFRSQGCCGDDEAEEESPPPDEEYDTDDYTNQLDFPAHDLS